MFAQKDMDLENMVPHALTITNVYSELMIVTRMLFVLIMVVGFTAIARQGFQKMQGFRQHY